MNIKRFFLLMLLIFTVTAANHINAQVVNGKGERQFNAGVGLSALGVPLYLGADFGVAPDFTLGAEMSFRRYYEKFNMVHSVTQVLANGNYHFNTLLDIPQNWDVYAGINLGFEIWHSPDTYLGNRTSGLRLGAQVGVRYYFNQKIGINLEGGSGNAFSGGKLGVSIRF